MGMPCEVNSILKLTPTQGYPNQLLVGTRYEIVKDGYRIFPVDVPLALVNEAWVAHADVVIHSLTWKHSQTHLQFQIVRLYDRPVFLR